MTADWDDMLDLFSSAEIEELGNRFVDAADEWERNGKPVVILVQPIEVYHVGSEMDVETAHNLLDAWTHYLDHDCPHGWEMLEEFLGAMLDELMANMIAEGDMTLPEDDEEEDEEG